MPYITHSGDFSIFFKKRLDRSETGCILNSSKQKCSTPFSGGVAQLVEQRTENPRVTSSILVLATIFVSTPVKPTGFFVFSPKTYPQKQPCGVSGKLSSTPKQYKVAHLLRFFGKYLCHPRFLTQYITYYKSTRVYYNIFYILSRPTIHTSRDANYRRSFFVKII